MTQNPIDRRYADFTSEEPSAPTEGPAAHQHRRGHGWLMWLMCLPMLALVGVLIATGAFGAGAVLYAVGCLALMAAMMAWMNHADRSR